MKKVRPKQKMENPINTATVETLSKMQGMIAVILKEVHGIKDFAHEANYDISVLEAAVDMNFWVHLKLVQEGHLDPESELRHDTMALLKKVSSMQQEYLAIMAISDFLSTLGSK